MNAHVPSRLGELVGFVPRGPPIGEPELGRYMPRAKTRDLFADPEVVQHPQPVRRQRHAGPNLGQLLGLLMHLDVDPGPRQRHRRRGPTDSAADNHRPQRHVATPSRTGQLSPGSAPHLTPRLTSHPRSALRVLVIRAPADPYGAAATTHIEKYCEPPP